MQHSSMNCIDVRRKLTVEPAIHDLAMTQHITQCRSCAAYLQQQNSLTDSVLQVMSVDVPQDLVSSILLQQSINENKHKGFYRESLHAIAASLILAVGVVTGLVLFNSPNSLDQLALLHVKDEISHLADHNNVSLTTVNGILQPFNMQLASSLGQVNYVGSCNMRVSKGVHLIIQGKNAPVTILFMPGEYVSKRQVITDAIFKGRVIPTQGGSLAIIGAQAELLDDIEQQLQQLITYI